MKKYWIQIIVLLLLVLLFSQFNISEYIMSMGALSLDIWLTLILLQILSFLLLLIQWKRISAVLGKKVSYRQLVSLNMRGVFYETITPGLKVGGEVAKGISLVNEMNFTTAQASALVVIQKCISIFALVLLSIISFILISVELELPHSLLFIVSISMIVILVFLMIILFIPEKIYNHLLKLKSKGKLKSRIKNFLEKYIVSFNEVKRNKQEIFFQLLLSLIIWIMFPFKLLFIVRALGLEVSFIKAFAVTIISYIAGMVPLLPGGLGSFEGTMIGLFILWGINKEQGLVIATLFRFTTFWLLFFISIIYLSIEKVHYRLKGV